MGVGPAFLGLDLGGTTLKACLLDVGRTGPRVAAERVAETGSARGAGAVLDRLAGLALELAAAGGPVQAVGLGAPGPLDLEAGTSTSMPNLPGFEGVPLAAELEARLRLPVALLNDARACTLAELRLGAGAGCRELVCFTLGTGVGGGVAIGGELLLTLGGTAGELGHQTIEPDGPPCGCGSHGCLEQYVSGPAIARAAGTESAAAAAEAAHAGDPAARRALERAGTILGIGISNVALAVGPERVIVGGGVAEAGELLLAPARSELARRNRMMPVERIAVVPAALGLRAGAIGAALWASEHEPRRMPAPSD